MTSLLKSLFIIIIIHLPVVLQTLSYKKTKTFATSIFIDLQKSFSRLLVKVTLTINIFLRGNNTLLTAFQSNQYNQYLSSITSTSSLTPIKMGFRPFPEQTFINNFWTAFAWKFKSFIKILIVKLFFLNYIVQKNKKLCDVVRRWMEY